MQKKDIIIISVISVLFLTYLVSLLSFGDYYRKSSSIILIGIIGCIFSFISFYGFGMNYDPGANGIAYYVNFHNIDFSQVTFYFSDNSSIILSQGESIFDVEVRIEQTIQAGGVTSTGEKIYLPYTHVSELNPDVYYTLGGAMTLDNFVPLLNIINQSTNSMSLYSSDINNKIYIVTQVSPSGKSTISSYIGQEFSTEPSMMSQTQVTKTNKTTLTISSDGGITIA